MNKLTAYIDDNQDRFVEELFDFLRIPSISTIPSHKSDIEKAALFVKDKLLAAGAESAYVIPTEGNPLVFGEKIIDPNLPTILVYGHYDVQPVDPLHLWDTPPFQPTLRKGKIYARGASDDKGQVYMHIKVLEAMMATGTLPCNIKFLIEGEEEVGSTNISHFIAKEENQKRVSADVVLVSDTTVLDMDTPSIVTGLRGIITYQLDVKGPSQDLHSGSYGGAVANPAEMLCRIIAQLKDKEGHISVPAFYDDVVSHSKKEREAINQRPFNLTKYKKNLGIKDIFGEKGYTTLERTGIRPTLEVNGISGGYSGEGIKTVLPSKAFAKISVRTVAHQDSRRITQLLQNYIKTITPKGVEVTLTRLDQEDHKPFLANIKGKGIEAACQAFQTVWGKCPHWMLEGGSIPILATFQHKLDTEVVNLGFGLDTDRIHSPNEHFGLANFMMGIKTIAAFHTCFAEQMKK